jgi:hypothetical protein
MKKKRGSATGSAKGVRVVSVQASARRVSKVEGKGKGKGRGKNSLKRGPTSQAAESREQTAKSRQQTAGKLKATAVRVVYGRTDNKSHKKITAPTATPSNTSVRPSNTGPLQRARKAGKAGRRQASPPPRLPLRPTNDRFIKQVTVCVCETVMV